MPTMICRDGSGDHDHPPHSVRIDRCEWIDDARVCSRGWGELALKKHRINHPGAASRASLWVGRRQALSEEVGFP